MKSNRYKWTTILLAVALVVVVYLLLTDSCNKQPESHNTEKAAVDRETKALKDSLEMYKRFDSSKAVVIRNQDSAIREIRKVEQNTRKQLNLSNSTAVQLRNELRNYREKDTGYVYQRIDSLLQEVDNLTFLLGQYQAATDSLSTAIENQKTNYESLAAKRAELLQQMKTSYDFVNSSYQGLFKDYGQLQKSIKREKLKTKIAAVIALVEGILLAVK